MKRKRLASSACASFRIPHSALRIRAFTLLEVILALGVLAAAVAVVGEVTRLSHRNAQRAALEGDALVIAESIMAQLLAGLIEPVELPPTEWVDANEQPTWRYSMQPESTDTPELLKARVVVEEITAADQQPIRVELVRWILDPDEVADNSSASASSNGGAG